jgi:hypothetical protein
MRLTFVIGIWGSGSKCTTIASTTTVIATTTATATTSTYRKEPYIDAGSL